MIAYCSGRTREDIHGEHCKNCRLGSGEGYVPRVLCGRGGELCAVEDVEAQPGSAFLRGAGAAPCMVAMETCTGANWWCRRLRDLGYDARLIPAAYVKPYVKSQKNDALDAEATCEAARRPNMRFAPVKSEEASAVLASC